MNQIQDDDIFSHMIDEILSYDAEFIQLLPQLANYKRPIDVLSDDASRQSRRITIGARLQIVHFRQSTNVALPSNSSISI